MLIYRIENAKGNGPYAKKDSAPTFFNKGGEVGKGLKSHLHPNPYQDQGLSDWWYKETIGSGFFAQPTDTRKRHIFGFSSIDQMKAWFYTKKSKEALHTDKFFVAVYSVRKNYVIFGHAQALYDKEKAEFVGAFDVRYM